jgi:methylmalonyl-CoA mutase N-terminal domain/subunit
MKEKEIKNAALNSNSKERRHRLESGIEVKPLYTPEDIKNIDYKKDIASPGEFPFVRGIHPLMYRKQPWTMRQYAGFGTPRQTNERFKLLIAHGQNALNVAFDLPTQMGLDSDDPEAEGEIGRVGMAVDTVEDFEIAFDGIDLEKVSVSLTINATAPVILAMYFAIAERRGINIQNLSGTLQNDILKEFIGRGAWIFPVCPSCRLVCDIMEYCTKYAQKYNPVSICGYHIRESGATPDQEMGYAFEIAKEYIGILLNRGINIDDFAPRISFNFNVFGNLWEQVTKFRAGRKLWAKIIRNEFGAKNPRSMYLRMIAGGGGSGLTIEEPENNIIRGAYYALAGALGGCQTMALCCYDEAYTIPSPRASLLSLRTMQILAEEMGLCDTVDPLAGSYFIETLTLQMEKKIVESMKEIESMGGMVKAIKEGVIQRKLAHQAYEYEQKIRNGEVPKVGINRYVQESRNSAGEDVQLHKYDPATVEEKIARLRGIKKSRDNRKVQTALDNVRRSAESGENVMPSILSAVKLSVTLGEITKALKDVFGTFKEPEVV